jgi:hypothetical protein
MVHIENLNTYITYIENDRLGFEKRWLIPPVQRFFGRLRGRSYDSVKIANASFTQENMGILQEKLSEIGGRNASIDLVRVILSQISVSEAQLSDVGMGKLLGSIQKKVGTTSPLAKRIAEVKEKVFLEKYGLPGSLVDTDPQSIQFLVKSRLLYTIVGLQDTSEDKKSFKIEEGKIYIPVNGVQTPVHTLVDRFSYDPVHLQLVEKETNLPWNYLLPQGLIQKDRGGNDELLHVTKLTKQEREELLEHAKKNRRLSFKGEEPTCVLQISTNPPNRLGKVARFPLMQGVEALDPVHIGFRIIDQEGNVFSTGFLTTDEGRYKKGIFNLFGSVNGGPGLVDYNDFRPFKGRFVTSIPMTQSTCEGVLKRVNEMRARGVRFNQGTQNCTSMALDILSQTGINIDNKLTRLEAAKAFLPHMASFPILNKIFAFSVSLSEKIAKKTKLPTLGEVERLFDKTVRLILTPIRFIDNIICNIVLLILGAGKGSPVRENVFTSGKGGRLRSFKSMINSPLEIFSSKPTTFSHSGPLIAWQLEQESTLFYTYKGPNMTVLPKGGELPSEEQKAAHKRFGNKEITTPTVWTKVANVLSKPTEWL